MKQKGTDMRRPDKHKGCGAQRSKDRDRRGGKRMTRGIWGEVSSE